MKQCRISLQSRIFILIIVIVSVSVSVKTFLEDRYFKNYILTSGAEKVLYVAKLTAMDPRIIDAFPLPDPSSVIQPLAERIREVTGTSFVVVINMDSIRYSHPNPGNIGKHFVGGDELDAIAGKTYVSEAKGTLGVSKRAFVPIHNIDGKQIGVVSVGLLLTELEEKNILIRKILFITALASISVGLGGAILLAADIRKTIFGLEPYQIAALLEERDAIISSIREGIIAVDRDGKIILINDIARKLTGSGNVGNETHISEIFPDSKIPLVLKTGREIINQEHTINGRHVLVNNLPLIHSNRIIGAMGTFIDMSEIRDLTEKLNEIKSYTDALRAQHHEYLNRLNVISGLIQLRKYREVNDFILSAVSSQQSISDLLRKRILTPAVSGLLIAKINKAREQHIALVISPDSFMPKISKKAVVPVVSIIGNIIENSIEALARLGQKEKTINMLVRETGADIEIRISDNGEGIPERLREKIFEYGFSSKDSGNNEAAGERGIGLFLVREQVEQLGGTIRLSAGRKTEFVVTLPLKRIV